MATATSTNSTAAKKAGGIKAITLGRSDIFMIDPRTMEIVPDFNARDFTTPENIAHVAWLADSIESEGVKEALRGYMDGSKFKVTNGESRLRAIQLLLDRGVEVTSVPARLEDRYSNDADRLYTQVTSNSGKAFTPLETSNLYRRMINLGQTEEQIAKRTATDVRRVKQVLGYQTLPSKVQSMIASGEIKATLAMETFIEKGRDEAATVEALTGAVENAKAAGATKVSKKYVGGTDGEKKASPAKQMKTERAFLADAFSEADFADDEDDQLGEITVITVSRADGLRIKEMFGL